METIRELFSESIGYIWIICLALWGGTVSYFSRKKRNNLPFSFVELIGEWCTSGFAGIITMYICIDLGLSMPIMAAITGMAGHMGGRAIYLLEQWMLSKFPNTPKK